VLILKNEAYEMSRHSISRGFARREGAKRPQEFFASQRDLLKLNFFLKIDGELKQDARIKSDPCKNQLKRDVVGTAAHHISVDENKYRIKMFEKLDWLTVERRRTNSPALAKRAQSLSVACRRCRSSEASLAKVRRDEQTTVDGACPDIVCRAQRSH
jgi:hypothetical protein